MGNVQQDAVVQDLVKREGTPFYLYDLEVLRRNYSALRWALPETVEILYSMKANPHLAVLRELRDLGSGLDVGSGQEIDVALGAGFQPSQISFVGPGKSAADLAKAIGKNIFCIVAESLQEIELIDVLASRMNAKARVCIRVNPKRYVDNSGVEVRGRACQFGLDEEQLDAARSLIRERRFIHLIGLHFYIGSQFFQARNLIDNFSVFLDVAGAFQARLDYPLEVINLGGGFGLPYFENQVPLHLGELKEKFGILARSLPDRKLGGAKLFVESGRLLVGSCGLFVTQVLYRKESRGRIYLCCDGGFSHHLAATGIDQVVRGNFPISVLKASGARGRTGGETVTIIGPSCYSRDVVAESADLAFPAEAGDLICVGNSGAYGLTFSPLDFLSPVSPGEFFVDLGS